MRMLLIFVALAIIVMVAKRLWLQSRRDDRQQRRKLSGKMVQCKSCGIYLPEQEAIRSGDNWYCSTEHSRADQHQD